MLKLRIHFRLVLIIYWFIFLHTLLIILWSTWLYTNKKNLLNIDYTVWNTWNWASVNCLMSYSDWDTWSWSELSMKKYLHDNKMASYILSGITVIQLGTSLGTFAHLFLKLSWGLFHLNIPIEKKKNFHPPPPEFTSINTPLPPERIFLYRNTQS